MAAKKARGWRSGRREGRSRMVQMTRHLVVSEGKETEPRDIGIKVCKDLPSSPS